MDSKRNSYLINQALKNFLFASVLTMLITQLTTSIDGIIVSHLVGPDALSAITLFLPVNLIITSVVTLFGTGATIIAAKAMGRRDQAAVTGILSTAIVSLIIVGFGLGILGFCFGDKIAGLLTNDTHLYHYLLSYLTVMLGCGMITIINFFFEQCVDIDGYPIKVTQTVFLIAITNIVLDLVLVGPVQMGIRGSAIATIAAYATGAINLGRHLFSSQSGIKLRFNISSFGHYIGGNLIQGLPMLIGNIVLTLLFYLMNNIVQDRLGHDGMFVMSVCMNIFMIGLMLANGFGSTIMSLGGFLYGQSDFTGVRIMVKNCLSAVVYLTLAFILLVEVFPSLLTYLFGANTPALRAIADDGVRIFIPCLTPFCLVLMFANLFQMLGRLVLSPILVLMFPVALLSTMTWFAQSEDDMMIWYAFPVSGVAVLLFTVILAEVIRFLNRTVKLTPLTLIPLNNSEQMHELSIYNAEKDYMDTIGQMHEILTSFHLSQEQCNRIQNSTEEVLINTLQHSGIKDNAHYTDLRFIQTTDTFTVFLKYEGKQFDPTNISEEDKKFGLKIVAATCDNIEYKYMFGQNMLYLSWEIK